MKQEFVVSNNGTLMEYNSTSSEVIIPAYVTAISGHAFTKHPRFIERLVIPASVCQIEAGCFYGCLGLKEVVVDKDNAEYSSKDGVLYDKSKTTLICYPRKKTDKAFHIPSSVITLESRSFQGCEMLQEVHLNTVRYIKDHAFYGCKLLTRIHPLTERISFDRPYEIHDRAFSYCTSLKNIYLPENLRSLGESIFAGCSELEAVHFHKKALFTHIPHGMFMDCQSLKEIVLPEGIESIGSQAFYNDILLCNVSLPDSLIEIRANAFGYCMKLALRELPPHLRQIGGSAFFRCTALTTMLIPDSVREIDDDAFYGCEALHRVEFGEGLNKIGARAFWNCPMLTSIRLPSNLTNIDQWSFDAGVDFL